MRILSALSALSAFSAFSAFSALGAQSLASRIANAPDGVVRMQVESRVGVCGDGRDVVGYKSAIFANNFQSIGGHWNDSRCVPFFPLWGSPLPLRFWWWDGSRRMHSSRS